MTNNKNTRLAVYCLLAIVSVYAVAVTWMLYVSFLVGELQNIYSAVIWGGLTVWCAYRLSKDSNRARKWSFAKFGIHGVFALFYLIFPLAMGDLHTVFMVVCSIFFLASLLGVVFASKAKQELAQLSSSEG